MTKRRQEKIDFVKMSGAGNDFVLVDNRSGKYTWDWSTIAPKICHRHYGVGSDGLLVLEEGTGSDFRMLYFNADGSSGGMCGNGGRCAARFVMDDLAVDEVKFEALDQSYYAHRSGSLITLRMGNPKGYQTDLTIDLAGVVLKGAFVDTGAPHVVLYVDDLPITIQDQIRKEGIELLGRAIRNHELFRPGGTNVNFVELGDHRTIAMRTYERGVEGETMACGTGAVACAVISASTHALSPPIKVKTRSGDLLTVDFVSNGSFPTEVELTGPARITFRGDFPIPIE